MHGDSAELCAMAVQRLQRQPVGLLDEEVNGFVDAGGSGTAPLPEQAEVLTPAEGDVADATHAQLADHAPGDVGDTLDILLRASGHLAESDLLRGAAAQYRGHAGEQLAARHEIAILEWGLDG